MMNPEEMDKDKEDQKWYSNCHLLNRNQILCNIFCKMNPKEFEGSTNPLDAEEWLSSIQIIMEFMELNDQERVIYASYMLKREPNIGGKQ